MVHSLGRSARHPLPVTRSRGQPLCERPRGWCGPLGGCHSDLAADRGDRDRRAPGPRPSAAVRRRARRERSGTGDQPRRGWNLDLRDGRVPRHLPARGGGGRGNHPGLDFEERARQGVGGLPPRAQLPRALREVRARPAALVRRQREHRMPRGSGEGCGHRDRRRAGVRLERPRRELAAGARGAWPRSRAWRSGRPGRPLLPAGRAPSPAHPEPVRNEVRQAE